MVALTMGAPEQTGYTDCTICINLSKSIPDYFLGLLLMKKILTDVSSFWAPKRNEDTLAIIPWLDFSVWTSTWDWKKQRILLGYKISIRKLE